MLTLTPEIMAAAYEYLRTVPPISAWKLPPAEEVVFKVSLKHDTLGEYTFADGAHQITASDKRIGFSCTLLALIAHEMVHMWRRLRGDPRWDNHGPDFKKPGRQICRVHGFDPKEF